jgi:mono/diheme cytochrome c family protein
MEENLQQLEATYGAPASLFERSAAARAKAAGSTAEAVAAEWVNVAGGVAQPSVPPAEGRGDAEERSDDAGGPEATDAPPAAALSGAALLTAVAEARGMPESLIERSAKARASATGGSVEAVLQAWAAEEGLTAPADVADDSAPPEEVAGGGADSGGVPADPSPAATLAGPALLAAVAEARGTPEALIERSAKARASAIGQSVESVLQQWAEEERLAAPADVPAALRKADAEQRSDEAAEPAVPSSPPSTTMLSGSALLAAVAEARGLPASLIERSATARAKTAGVELDDVLREWAEEEGLDVGAPADAPAVPGRGDSDQSSDAAGDDVTPPAEVAGGSLLAAVAAARKMPESLVERSAKARAKQQGGTVDDVLAEWAAEEGIDVAAIGTAVAPADDSPEEIEETSDATASDVPVKAAIPSPGPDVAIEEPRPTEPPSPRSRYPAWLAAVLVVVPLLAVLYVVVVPNQPTCGSAGQLAIDPATGEAVGCEGGAYGADQATNFAVGAEIYGAACAVCHGVNGGGGAGPAMAGGAVLEAFPADACSSQIEWVTLGSSNWPDATYGANGTPVAGGMPGFEGQLTETEIAQVILYERVEFGGLDVVPAEADCGFEAAGAEG